jgi:hypothetical protein
VKLLSNQIVYTQGSEYLDFEINKEEKAFLTPSRLSLLAKQIAPQINLAYSVPPVLGYNPDENGNCKIRINVAVPYKEQFVKEILTQYVKANLLTLEEANNIYEPVCQKLNTKFKPINPDESATIKTDQVHDFMIATQLNLLEGIIKSSVQNKNDKAQSNKRVQKEKHDDFGSELTGLKGAFK